MRNKEITNKILKEKHADKEWTFAPKINKHSTRNLDISINKSQEPKTSQYNSRTERNLKKFESRIKRNKAKEKGDREWTFAPAIDIKSVQILEKRKEREQEIQNENVFNRLRMNWLICISTF